MIYVKENNEIITANILVHEDFINHQELEKYYANEIYLKNDLLTKNVLTKSRFENYIEEENDEEYEYESDNDINLSFALTSCINKSKYAKKNKSNEELFKEIETIINSNLPSEMKKEYLKKCYFYFQDFVMNMLSNLKLQTYRTYNIEELKKIVELCDKAQVFTTAKMIISEENIEVAEENNKILKLSKQFLNLK